MTSTKNGEQAKDLERSRSAALHAVIEEQLVHRLGRPDQLLLVQVRLVGDNRYRVNVLVGMDIVSARIAHSYFMTIDRDGHIVESVPTITRLYGTEPRSS